MPDLEQLTSHGWELLRLKTDQVSVDVVPDLGGTIVSFKRLSDDTEILWQTPWGLRTRGAVGLPGDGEAIMLGSYPGGWQTVFPNGGDSAIAHGVEWGYNGEARVAPFDWEQAGSSIIMKSRLVRSPFEVTKIISLTGSTLTVGETARNVSAEDVEVMWGNQVAFGAPLISADTVVEAAATTVHPDPTQMPNCSYSDITPWPRTRGADSMINLRTLPGPDAGESRLAYLGDFDRPQMSIRNPLLALTVDLEWDHETWPYVWYSLESGKRKNFPWFGGAYFLALQPGTSWPAHGIHDARRVSQSTLWIQPGEAKTSHLSLQLS